MSLAIHSEGRGDFSGVTNKSIVSVTAFNNEFYSYTAGTNPTTFTPTGVFSLVTGATATTCPAGRVLHLTGRKLYPDVNPMTTFVGALTAKKFLVSVYDPISFLNGFIDPSSSTFAKFDQNVPNFFDLGTAGSGVTPPLGGQGSKITASNSSALTVSAFTSNAVTLSGGNATSGEININVGIGGAATNTITVNTTAATANSLIFLSTRTPKNTVTDIYQSNQTAGSFTITVVTSGNIATQSYVFNFLIVN
jgi:hypothetical protein